MQQIVLFCGCSTKSVVLMSSFFQVSLTRSNPGRMSIFELCLHCLPGKRGLVSATKVLLGFVLKWVSTIWDLPKSYIILS